MGYPTDSTMWPSAQPSVDIKQLLDKFFGLVDNKADNAGEKLATEIFTSNGKFYATSGNFQGSAGISPNLLSTTQQTIVLTVAIDN